MTPKIRHIDFYPDEFIAGCSGKLTPEQAGVYWFVCTLIYSRGTTIDDDAKWLGNIMGGTHWRTIRKILDGLITMGKIEAKDGQLWVQRCSKELAKTEQRISKAAANGKQGGRPSNKNNDLDKAGGLKSEKLTINHQPTTNNHQPITTKEYMCDFESWWKDYPKKRSKLEVEKIFIKVLQTKKATVTELMEGLKSYNKDIKTKKTALQYVKMPATYLNQGCWQDVYEPKRDTAKW